MERVIESGAKFSKVVQPEGSQPDDKLTLRRDDIQGMLMFHREIRIKFDWKMDPNILKWAVKLDNALRKILEAEEEK